MRNKVERRQFVYDTLTAHVTSSQKAIKSFLDGSGVRYYTFWVNNSLFVYDLDALGAAQALDVHHRDRWAPLCGVNAAGQAAQSSGLLRVHEAVFGRHRRRLSRRWQQSHRRSHGRIWSGHR